MDLWEAPDLMDRFSSERDAERTLQITFPLTRNGAPPSRKIMAQRAHLEEAISEPWCLTVHVLAESRWYYREGDKEIHDGVQPHPEQFLGHHARVVIQADGRSRVFDGVIMSARQLGRWHIHDDFRDAFDLLELVIRPTLALLDLRRNCRVFHNKCPAEIAQDLINEHIGDSFAFGYGLRWEHAEPLRSAPRSYLTQYKESDLTFIQRLLAGEGLNYTLPHDPDAEFGHRLKVFLPEKDFGPEPEVVLGSDYGDVGLPLLHWHARRSLAIARTRLSSPDYLRHPTDADSVGRDRFAFRGAASGFGDYIPLRPNARPAPDDWYGHMPHDLGRDAALRQWAHDLDAEIYEGATTAPLPLAAAVRVQGIPHSRHTRLGKDDTRTSHSAAADYVVTRQSLTVRVALHPELQRALDRSAPDLRDRAMAILSPEAEDMPRLLSRFEARPRGLAIVPDPARLERPTPCAVTATVVPAYGNTKQVVHTDEFGRIAVKMHWQRPVDSAPAHERDAYAKGEPTVWLRYVQPGAGDGIGFQYLPRVGDEVLVMFLDGDPDRPIAVGSLYNGQNKPPAFGGSGALPENKVLTGLRTREHHGSGGNELCMDDTEGEVGLRLASSTCGTSLTLGHVATPRTSGKSTPRGIGAELRSDGAAALRALEGVLLTTYAASKDAPQLAHDDLASLIERCQELTSALSAVAEKAGSPLRDGKVAQDLQKTLSVWTSGKHKDPAPIAVATAGHLIAATASSQLSYAGGNMSFAADGHVQSASGGTLCLTSGHQLSLFAADDGMDLTTGRGNLSIRAQSADVVAEASQSIQLSATEGAVRITAPTIELIAHDGSYIRLGGGVEWGATVPARCRTGEFKLSDPARADTSAVMSSHMATDQQIEALYCIDPDGSELPARGRAVHATDGDLAHQGTTTTDGRSEAMSDSALRQIRASIRELKL